MINLRMIGLASALLLLLPIGVMAMPDDGDEPPSDGSGVGGYQEVTATVYDVVLAQMPREKEYDAGSYHEEERLVEGHTAFVVLDVTYRYDQGNGTVDIMGMVDCKAEASYTGPTFLGIPLPERVDKVEAGCRVDEYVIVAPDPFAYEPQAAATPTGRLLPFDVPGVGHAYAEELSYPVRVQAPGGASETVTFYAWKVPIWQTWIDHHGRPKNFYAPLAEDKLAEMGIQDYRVYHEEDWARLG
jgi:hypothetical protein